MNSQDLENWSIDVEDGVRSARMGVDVMLDEDNPLILANLVRAHIPDLPPQVIGIMHHLAERLISYEAAVQASRAVPLPSGRQAPTLRLVQQQ